MALRKASSYSKKRVRPYTRKSSKRKKAYIKAIPVLKIVKYNMGDKKGFTDGKHKYNVTLVSTEKAQMRDNALESCRTTINKTLDKEIPGNYYFIIKVYPHHILRENKTAAGAGADRLSSGMKHSFGVAAGRAAIINKGKEIFFVSCTTEKAARVVRAALTKVKPKVPFKNRIVFEKVE
ncbi:MAG: 50S ribosomal protein L16 [Nanoarchaeota archaeon]|nr:50S ribosomal protein L16 [Nanoarchaeota archaeon]MBU1051112.1 50S ribosomal protein L16 [Nanoarchaeota archaeon]MBU1987968.1 50S ribosomal protein L16 [Nanoarchaeota archaeon]